MPRSRWNTASGHPPMTEALPSVSQPAPTTTRSPLGVALRYVRTVRHLRPMQVYGRLWHRLHVPKADTRPAPKRRERGGRWCAFLGRAPSMEGPGAFRFLNQTGEVHAAADWNAGQHEKLWLYNLHYFDDLNAVGCESRAAWHNAVIARWISDNLPGQGNGWEPYPLSLRIVNWIKWSLAGHALEPGWVHSLAIQARFLSGRIEWHLFGNHLFANAKALIFAGTFFEGAEADAWLKTGLRILVRELSEQVLADGGHFERSPMYHAIIQEDLLDLVNLARACPGVVPEPIVETWQEALGRMRRWLAAMCHPDKEISFFNDAAFGIAVPPAALEGYARDLDFASLPPTAQGVVHLKESGYIRVALGPQVAILDVAPVGPDYLPGHAHADTLSFELSVAGQRVVVNSGTSVYGAGPERQRQRGTAAHSTVEVDGDNSSEVWAAFRVGRRARVAELAIDEKDGQVQVIASHDGYKRLGGGAVHRREWAISGRQITLRDFVSGEFGNAVARFHLAPDVKPKIATAPGAGASGSLLVGSNLVVRWRSSAPATIEPSEWHPEFGSAIETNCICVSVPKEGVETIFDW